MGGIGVAAATDNDGVGIGEICVGISKCTGLARAAGGIIPGVEIEDYPSPAKLLKIDDLTRRRGCGKLRSFVADFQHTIAGRDRGDF